MLKRALVLIVSVLCGAMFAAPAQAAPPERFTDHFVESDSIDCSEFDPSWTFRDDYLDTYDIDATLYFGEDGELVRVIERWVQHSDDVNSATGFTLHEHNHFVAIFDLVNWTVAYNGAKNVMQRPGVGSVIRWTGHKVYPIGNDVPVQFSGPGVASDEDFCRAIA